MEENDNNIDQLIELINQKINNRMNNFKEELENNLNELQNKINEEMKNIGILETSIINRKIEYKKSLVQKIVIGTHYLTLGLSSLVIGITYGLFWVLPNYIINKFKYEKKFNEFIDELIEVNELTFNSYSDSIKKNINKFKNLTIENSKRLLGLKKAYSMGMDDLWREAKSIYEPILSKYKELRNNQQINLN